MDLDGHLSSLKDLPASEFLRALRSVKGLKGVGEARIRGGMVELPGDSRIIFVGDIHGDLECLKAILNGVIDEIEDGSFLVFLGDYGDRGGEQIEVYYTILRLREEFPDRIVMLRGNHEGPMDLPFHPWDLPWILRSRFGERGEEILGEITDLWDKLYHAVLVPGRVLAVHGGAPTEARSRDDIALANLKHPIEPHLGEILWNDPREIKGRIPSPRGYGWLFGADISERILGLVGARVMIRSHEPCNGYSIGHGGMIVTIFSSKNPYLLERGSYLVLEPGVEPNDAYDLIGSIRIF